MTNTINQTDINFNEIKARAIADLKAGKSLGRVPIPTNIEELYYQFLLIPIKTKHRFKPSIANQMENTPLKIRNISVCFEKTAQTFVPSFRMACIFWLSIKFLLQEI